MSLPSCTCAVLQTFVLQWREAECLAFSPHTFSRLKQLPELRQIISHTCLDALHAAAGRMTQHLVEYAADDFEKQHDERDRWQDYEPYDLDTDDVDDTHLSRRVAPHTLYRLHQNQKDASLLQHLAPGLRLCLAAEVAVGLLCQG
jgi:hypothetical protein